MAIFGFGKCAWCSKTRKLHRWYINAIEYVLICSDCYPSRDISDEVRFR